MTEQNDTGKHISKGTTGPMLSSQWYEVFKWVALVFLPAFGTAYFGLGNIWEFPEVEKVVGSVVVLETFLGLLLGVSSRNYNRSGADGSINASIEGGEVVISRLSLPDISADELAHKKSITIQVNPSNNASQ